MEIDQINRKIPELGFSTRSKTTLRLQYEAQSKVIEDQIGDLDSVRQRLGLSARKMCQLLLVDPSAWNRWTAKRHGSGSRSKAPPHVWRSLQWYLALEKQLPGLNPGVFGGSQKVLVDDETKAQVQALNRMLERQSLQLRNQRAMIWGLAGLVLIVILFQIGRSN